MRNKILTLKEAARLVGISRVSIYNWIALGLPHHKLGWMSYVYEEDLKKFERPRRGRKPKKKKK